MIRTFTSSARALKQLVADPRFASYARSNSGALSRLLSTKPSPAVTVVPTEVVEESMLEITEVNQDGRIVEVEETSTPTQILERGATPRPERSARPSPMTEEALEGTITEGAKIAAGHARDMVANFRPSLITTEKGQLVSRRLENFAVSEVRMEEIKENLDTSRADREQQLDTLRAREAADLSMAALEHNPNYPYSLDSLVEATHTARVKTETAGGTVQKKRE